VVFDDKAERLDRRSPAHGAHDEEHNAADGTVISQDCETCHRQ
jgi:hypothetical protein